MAAPGSIPDLKRRLVLSPDDAEARWQLGEALLREGDADGAARQLERAARLDPSLPGVFLLLGKALEQQQRPGAACEALRAHLRQHPGDAAAHGELAEILEIGGFLDEALLHAERAAEAAGQGGADPASRLLRVVELCQRKGLEERAVVHLRRALRRGPDGRLLAALRELYIDLGDEEAALRLAPRPELLDEAGRAAAAPLLLEAGGGLAASAAASAPGSAAPAQAPSPASAETARRALSDCAAAYRRALRASPDDPALLEALGDALALLGERGEAEWAYRAAIARGRGSAERALSALLDEAAPAADVGAQLRAAQRGPAAGRLHVLAVRLSPPDPTGQCLPLHGVATELQAVTYPGRGEISCTGVVGPELLDEARAAGAFVRAQAAALGLSQLTGDDARDVHLHYVRPRAAGLMEGRSGGLAQVLALVSAASGRPLRAALAASGSITPLGEVHRVEGVREKLMAAYHAGLRAVVLPRACLRQVRETPAEVRGALEILYVDSALEACRLCLLEAP